MTTGTALLTPGGRGWVRSTLLLPLLRDLRSQGKLHVPPRFPSEEEGFDALARLFDEQMILIEKEDHQTIRRLAQLTNLTPGQVEELLASVKDWSALIYGARLRSSNRGSIGMDASVFVLKTAHWKASGPGVFAACSPAYPRLVKEVLERYALDTGSRRPQDPAYDSALVLIECNPEFNVILAVAALPEGTQWDENDERYPVEVRDEVRTALEATAGADYTVSTPKIVREAVLGPFVAGLKAHGRKEKGMPMESGCITYAKDSNRYLGGELDMIRDLRKCGFESFLDIPHDVLPGRGRKSDSGCMFKFPNSGELYPASLLTWTARNAFGGHRLPSPYTPVFRVIDKGMLEMASADPNAVDYAIAQAGVGKADAPRRLRMGLLVRNEAGVLTGWGIPRLDCSDDWKVRQAIEQAERNILRMRPEGEVQQAINGLQAVGLQRTGAKKLATRVRRESFLLAASIFRSRALIGI